MFGIMNGRSGSPERVSRGSGPIRSIPNRRRLVSSTRDSAIPLIVTGERLGGASSRPVERIALVLSPRPRLRLYLVVGQAAGADRDSQRTPQELGVGELLTRPRLAVVENRLDARLRAL